MYPELLYIMWVQAVSVGEGVVCGMLETKRLVRVCVCVCVCDTPHFLIPVHTQGRATYSR